jgi:DNA-binding protein H-NS
MVKPNLNDLLAQRAALEQQIALAQREERADAVARVRTLMTEYGLTLADIGGRAVVAPPGAGKRTGKPAPVKYRDSATGSTWSGRGLQPKWLRAALATGRSLSDFLV